MIRPGVGEGMDNNVVFVILKIVSKVSPGKVEKYFGKIENYNY